MSNIRELSQLASVIVVGNDTKNVGIGFTLPTSKLSVNGGAFISGVVTASSFDGSVIQSQYSSTSGISSSSQGLTGSPNITVNDIVANTASFSGNVSVAGTLTYEDVTNVDSIGIITARSGISIGPTSSIGATITSYGDASFVGVVTSQNFSFGDGSITSTSAITTTTSQSSIDSFSTTLYRSSKYQIQITKGSEYQITEIFVIHDGFSTYQTEYATIKTGSTLSEFDTDITSGNVRLLATPSSIESTTFKIIRTAIKI